MILSRFLKPKWQQADPETRKQALQGLENTDPVLVEMARQDPDPVVRRTALERLDDLDLLGAIAGTDADASVRAAAQDRYQSLMAGAGPNSPGLEIRLERLRQNKDPGLAEHLLHHATEPELRLAALEHIDLESSLTEIALRDSHSDLRLAALERIQDPELLDHIARESRNRDKRLYRRARERLDALVAAQACAAHLERLCVEMENLVWDGESGPNAGRFPRLEQEWRDREAAAPPELRERYAQGIAWGEMKQLLFEYLNARLSEPRQRYDELLKAPDHIEQILKRGAVRAREYSAPFLQELRRAVGIRPLGAA